MWIAGSGMDAVIFLKLLIPLDFAKCVGKRQGSLNQLIHNI